MHLLRESLGRRLVFPNKSVGLSIKRFYGALVLNSNYTVSAKVPLQLQIPQLPTISRSASICFVLHRRSFTTTDRLRRELTCHLRGIRGNAVMVSLANVLAKRYEGKTTGEMQILPGRRAEKEKSF